VRQPRRKEMGARRLAKHANSGVLRSPRGCFVMSRRSRYLEATKSSAGRAAEMSRVGVGRARSMRITLLAAGIFAVVIGLIWIGQGTGYFPYPSSSFMINQVPWIYTVGRSWLYWVSWRLLFHGGFEGARFPACPTADQPRGSRAARLGAFIRRLPHFLHGTWP
jgi:hypothetical protein